jgi:hypothetical protein
LLTISPIKQITIVLISLGIIMSFTEWSHTEAQTTKIDLLGQQAKWQPHSGAIINQNKSSLEIIVITNETDKTWHRAYLPVRISSSNATSIPFTLEYASKSNLGNASFQAQIRDNSSSKALWTGYLNNTGGQLFNKTFTLPSSILNRPVELRFNVVTNGTGEHTFDIKKATMSLTNATQPVKVDFY